MLSTMAGFDRKVINFVVCLSGSNHNGTLKDGAILSSKISHLLSNLRIFSRSWVCLKDKIYWFF